MFKAKRQRKEMKMGKINERNKKNIRSVDGMDVPAMMRSLPVYTPHFLVAGTNLKPQMKDEG